MSLLYWAFAIFYKEIEKVMENLWENLRLNS